MIYIGDSWTDYAAVLLVAGLLYSGFAIFMFKCVVPSLWPVKQQKKKGIPSEVCRKRFCRRRRDCRFYIDNWQRENMVINTETDLENLPDKEI